MFKALLKKQMREFFVGVTTGRKTSGSKKLGKAGFIALYVICFISLGFAFFGMGQQIIDAVAVTGQGWLFYTLMAIVAITFAVVGSSFTAYTSIYNAKDNELLLSMPIPTVYLLVVRLITVFLLAFMFEGIVFLPSIIVYCMTFGWNVMNVMAPIIVLISLSFLATVLSSLLGWVIGLIASRTKNKNIATVIVSLLFIVGYYIFYFNIQQILASVVLKIDDMHFAMHIIGDAATGKILPLIGLVLVTLILFAAMCIVLSRSFISIVTKKVGGKKTVYKQQTLQQTDNIKKVLLKKELKHFKNSAVYMLNCGLGALMMPAAGIILLIKMKDLAPLLDLIPDGFLEVGIMCATIMIAGMNVITAPSISLEGQSFWIARSMPIKSSDILESKINLQKIITVPPAIIMVVLSAIAFHMNISDAIFIALTVYASIMVEAQCGIMLNLKMPNLEWTNEVVPVKRSLAVLIAMFGSWIIAALIALVFFLLRNVIGYSTFITAIFVIMILAARLLGDWIRKRGSELLEAIPA